MSHSQRLRLSDVRPLLRLVGEVVELGNDPLGWRRHVLDQLGRRLGMKVGVFGEMWNVLPGRAARVRAILDMGWDDSERLAFGSYMSGHNPVTDPSHNVYMGRGRRTTTC